MDRGWPDFTFEVLLQRQAHARSTCSSWRIWKTPPAASTLGRRKRTHRTSTDDRVQRRRPTHCRKNRPRPLALIDPEPRRCLPSGFFEVRWSGSAAETICCRAAPVRGSGRDARRCGRRLRRNRDRPSGTSAHRGHRKPPRREWADREINPPKNPGQQSGISVGCRRSGKPRVGGSTQSTGGPIRFTPGGRANPGTVGILTASAATAVPCAIDGTRLDGGGVPVLTHSSIAV